MEITEINGMRRVETKINLPSGVILSVSTTQFLVDSGMPSLGWSSRDWGSRYEAMANGKVHRDCRLHPETQLLVDEAIKAQKIALGVYVAPETKAQRAQEAAEYEVSRRRVEAMSNMGDSDVDEDAEDLRIARAERAMSEGD